MPSGYTATSASLAVDLDDIFALIIPGSTPAAPVNLKVNNSDLSSRYEPITTANQQISFNVNFQSNGTDLRYIFADKNFTPTPTITSSPTLTPTISITPTLTPTPTISISATATPTPTPTTSPLPVTSVTFTPSTGGTYNSGDSISVSVSANNGHTPVTGYQWYNWNGIGYVAASGQTSNTYVIGTSPAGTPDDFGSYSTYYYAVKITNAGGTSDYFEWEVNVNKPTPTPTRTPTLTPTISISPTATPTPTPTTSPLPVTSVSFSPNSGGTYNFGDSISVSVSALNGHTPVTGYQWYNWNGVGYVVASGQTSSTYIIGSNPPGTPDDFGSYKTYYYAVKLTNAGGTSDFFEWEVNINAPTPTPTPTISITPTPTQTPPNSPTPTPTPTSTPLYLVTSVSFNPGSGGTYNFGDSLAVSVSALNGSTPVTSYQWYNWNGIGYVTGGSSSSTYILGSNPPGTPDDFGSYKTYYYAVTLTNAAGTSGYFEWEVNVNAPTPTPTPTPSDTPDPTPTPTPSTSYGS